MPISDQIQVFCAVVSLIAALVIGALQIRQSNRMEAFERRQDARDENRHMAKMKAQAVKFISENYNYRGLIPLCAIAAMDKPTRFYHRKMYTDFCCLTQEVQNLILEYCELDLRVETDFNLYSVCLDKLSDTLKKYLPNDANPFYEAGKYIRRSVEQYANADVPVKEYKYEKLVTDVLSQAIISGDAGAKPIEFLNSQFDFGNCREIIACWLVSEIASYLAIYTNEQEDSKDYGSPGAYSGEQIETMEDLYLFTLFNVYTNLVLGD